MEKNVNGVMMKVMEMKGSNEAKFLGGRQKTSGIGSELKMLVGLSVFLFKPVVAFLFLLKLPFLGVPECSLQHTAPGNPIELRLVALHRALLCLAGL